MAKGPGPLNTAVGKKIVMALTGLALCFYLVTHLAGNLVLLMGDQKFNAYAHTLTSLPIIPIIELGLLAIFLIHIYDAVKVSVENRKARPVGYESKVWARNKSKKSRKSAASSTMMWSGIVILVFTVLHILHFKYGTFYPVESQSQSHSIVVGTGTSTVASTDAKSPQEAHAEVRDLAYLVISEFKKPLVMLLYVAAMIALGLHLYHAFWSAFQSLGVSNTRYTAMLRTVGQVFTLVIAGGFIFLPLWVFFAFPAPKERTVAVSPKQTIPANSEEVRLGTRR